MSSELYVDTIISVITESKKITEMMAFLPILLINFMQIL